LPRYDFQSPRLYVPEPLAAGARIALTRAQDHYLRHVLRLKPGAAVLAFNGRDGEWRAGLAETGKRSSLEAGERIREQTPPSDLHYLFAPLKHERLDYMVQKAVEMGASLLQPVLTRHTQVHRVNTERMRGNAVEAAEQCGVLSVPGVEAPVALARALAKREPERLLVFCDEDAETGDPVTALTAARPRPSALAPVADVSPSGRPPLAVLIGPEGGFAEEERAALLKLPNVVRLALGPRILRADTAAVAALALVQAVLGDWR
jgi:16S rRNA (uracil1498-N3)-methyltransferase